MKEALKMDPSIEFAVNYLRLKLFELIQREPVNVEGFHDLLNELLHLHRDCHFAMGGSCITLNLRPT